MHLQSELRVELAKARWGGITQRFEPTLPAAAVARLGRISLRVARLKRIRYARRSVGWGFEMRDTYIVSYAERLFRLLRSLTVFGLIYRIAGDHIDAAFVDSWVLGNLVLSFIGVLICRPSQRVWMLLALAFGCLRIFEVVVYQVNVLFFDEQRAWRVGEPYEVRGYRRLLILGLANYAEVTFWFSAAYRAFSEALVAGRGVAPGSVRGALYYSVVTITTLGFGDIHPKDSAIVWVVIGETIIGVFMALVIVSRLVSLLPRPATSDKFEKEVDENR